LTLFKLLLILNLSNASADAESTTVTKPQTILVLGDSLSAAHNISTESGWVTLLQEQFKQQSCNTLMINASISGETSSGGLSRLPKLLTTHQPSLVILELGANDGLRGLDLNSLKQNLEQIIKLSHQTSAKVLLVQIRIPSNYGSRYTRSFEAVYAELAQQYDLTLIPFLLNDIALKPELMQSDGLHPTAQAQTIIVDHVSPYISSGLNCTN